MAVVPNDNVRLTAVMSHLGQGAIMNVFDVKLTGTTTYSDDDFMDEAEQFLSDVYTAGQGALSDGTVPVEIRGFNWVSNGPMPVTAWTHWAGGIVGGETLPSGCAALLLFRTGQLKVLGRKFIGGLSESASSYGELTAGTLNALALFAAELAVGHDMATGDGHLRFMIRNRFGNMFDVIDVTLRTTVAYQRRRKRGVGL